MHLKHLSISGFKSFAKKSELEFSVPITAIVGPNGSGKSNVAEAFRFVLGEQSVKSMRGKRGEDLIFNGSDSVSRGNRAEVSVLLDNQSRVFPVDFDEVTVTRTVHRDGQNEYEINGSKVRLKDVQELLAAANIGSTGHHIISQGEADRILSASAKERREMVEDALGLKVFQYKKFEAERKLKKSRENVEQVQSLRREVAPHLKFLERQVKKIERSIELRKELTSKYLEYLKREDTYIAHHHDRLTKERHIPASALKEMEVALSDAKDKLAASEQDGKSHALVELEEKLAAARRQRQELLRKDGQLEGQAQFLERRIKEITDRANRQTEVQIPGSEVNKLITSLEATISKQVQSDSVPVLQRALQDVLHALKKFLQTASGNTTVSTKAEEDELADMLKQRTELARDLKAAESSETLLMQQYDELKTQIEAESQESREAEREVFRIVGEQRDRQAELDRIDAELRNLDRDRDEFKRELQEAVALIGRDSASYFDFQIVVGGVAVTTKEIVSEARDVQWGRRRELEKMKIRLEELGGSNEDIEKEYREVKERDEFLEREITDLEESITKLELLIKELTDQLNEHFVGGIEKIDVEFNKFFTLMFGGGEAKIVRIKPKKKQTKKDINEYGEEIEVDEEVEDEEAQEGIELDVKLPNKKVRGLEMLSGGERALTSIALIFAMSQVNPPLFIILDETDAALDEANSRRYGDMIEALAKKSQLILITHNRETMSRAGILYGVTMAGDGVSKLLSVKLDEAVAVAK